MNDGQGTVDRKSTGERRALRLALWLNAGLAASLVTTGIIGESSGLIANGLDNTSDAAVYAISYLAVTRSAVWKTRAAQLSGVMLLVLSGSVLVDVARRFLEGAEPASAVMMVMAVVAAVVNIVSLNLLRRIRQEDVNLRAAWTFSINDLIANLGVIAAGILVAVLGRAWPDLVVGLSIALVAAKGGIEILVDAQREGQSD